MRIVPGVRRWTPGGGDPHNAVTHRHGQEPCMPRASLLRSFLAALAALAVASSLVAAAPPDGAARIHYHRPRGDYAGWGLHAWEDAAASVQWTSPLAPTGTAAYGVHRDVPL